MYEFYQFWNPVRRDYAVSDLAFMIAIAPSPLLRRPRQINPTGTESPQGEVRAEDLK